MKLIHSPIMGQRENIDFLVWLGVGIPPAKREQVLAWIDAAAPLPDSPEGV